MDSVQTHMPGQPPVPVTDRDREACEACLLTALVALAEEREADSIHAPPEALNQVRFAVRQGLPVTSVVRSVWASHSKTQDALLAQVGALLSPVEIVPTMLELNDQLFTIVNCYVGELMAEYDEELSVWRGQLSEDRRRVVDSLMAGAVPHDAERILGLRLTDAHLVAFARQAADGFVATADQDLARFVGAATKTLSATGCLILPQDGETLVWWTFAGEPPAEVERALEDASVPPWMRLAVGEPGRGVTGFRDALDSAKLARLATGIDGANRVQSYASTRLVCLGLTDPGAASLFVRSVLRGALADDDKVAEYRSTALAYLEAGGSLRRAAARLNVAPNTVTYRVARLAELLGRPVTDRPAETLAALVLAEAMPSLLAPIRRNPVSTAGR
jgi:hypothetical protein